MAVLDLSSMTFEELSRRLEVLEDDELVLLLSGYVDQSGKRLSFRESLALIIEHSPVPIFHLWNHGMGEGLFGGVLISQFNQARTAAGLLRQNLFNGVEMESLPVIDESPNAALYDYEVMKGFGISRHRLPPQAQVINDPVTFFQQYGGYLVAALIIIITQTLLIAFLILKTRMNHRLTKKLRDSENRYRDLFENSPIALMEEDFSAVDAFLKEIHKREDPGIYLSEHPEEVEQCASRIRILNVNQEAQRLFEAESKEDLLTNISRILTEQSQTLLQRELEHLSRGKNEFAATALQKRLSGEDFWAQLKIRRFSLAEERDSRLLVGLQDIMETILTSRSLEKSNREKELLLKEIHHRVNNNFSLIISILVLQLGSMKSDEARTTLEDIIIRIKAMALVHKNLYLKTDLKHIALKEYLQDLMGEVKNIYERKDHPVQISLRGENPQLSSQVLVPLGLIITEITANAFKHAFNQTDEPQITIEITQNTEGSLSLKIRDNGVGSTEEIREEAAQAGSIGLLIIDSLLQQLQAASVRTYDRGTCYEITLPLGKKKDIP